MSGSTGLVANAKLLTEIGVCKHETVDEFLDTMRKIRKAKPNSSPLGLLATMTKEGLIVLGNDRFDFRGLFAKKLVALYPDPLLARAFARAQSGQGEA